MRLLLALLLAVSADAQYFPSETINPTGLALSGEWILDGAIYATPQAAAGCILVATMGGSLYCLDPLHPGVVGWRAHLADPKTTGTATTFYSKTMGCLSRPAVDTVTNRAYVACASATDWAIYTVDLTSGTVLGSTIAAASVTGTGCGGTDPVVGGSLQFSAPEETQKAALLLAGSTLVVSFSSWNDTSPWHGWVMTYDVSGTSPVQTHAWASTPNGCGGAVWQSAGAIVTDGTYFYLTTGNGTLDLTDYSMSALKLDGSLNVVGQWTPAGEGSLNANDADVSSGAPLLLAPGALAIGFKDWKVRLIDTSTMTVTQELPTNPSPPPIDGDSGIYGGIFADGVAYFPNKPGNLYAFPFSTMLATPTASPASYTSTMAIAVTGAGSEKLVWVVTTDVDPYSETPWVAVTGTLRALNPSTLAEVWSADIGRAASFSGPTFLGGRAYVGNVDGGLRVFSHDAPTAGTVLPGNSVTLLSWDQH